MLYPLATVFASSKTNNLFEENQFPVTKTVLTKAYRSEIFAFEHYVEYSRKALKENFHNIAYLFTAFSVSEKTHAENYKKILRALGKGLEDPEIEIRVSDTRTNLINASAGELEKIRRIYPEFLAKLKHEAHDQAVVNCMYSWKSHRQHKRKISAIRKYSKLFFGPVAKKIEGMNFDFHICKICGSTVDKAPQMPCEICNYPISHYHKIKRPA